MNYQYLLKNKQLFPAAIGINYSQFKALLDKFSPKLKEAERLKAYSFKRLRAPGAGRKAFLNSDAKKLFFILFYYKVYPTLQLAQLIFHFDKENIRRWKIFLEKVLHDTLGYQLALPTIKVKQLSQVLTICPQLKHFIIDATERPINRPKHNQKFFYSGKKKKHTLKNHTFVDPKSKKILAISKTAQGKMHDKKLAEDDPLWLTIPPGSIGMGDLGYQAMDQINPFVKFITPYKKPKGKDLSDFQKQNNKQISSIRVRSEHPFAFMKHFNILSNKLRIRLNANPTLAHLPFENIACIYNFTRNYR